jgi:large subunit ribosomal protein L13
MKTYSAKASDLNPQWHMIDATDRTLGRLATEVATLLMGKNKPTYTPNMNTGDFVVVINASRIRVTGNKGQQKFYYRHSNYPGGLKSTSLTRMIETHPTRVIEHAVRGMIPHNRLGRAMMKRLKVYAGDKHPYQPQMEQAAPKSSPEEKSRNKGGAN